MPDPSALLVLLAAVAVWALTESARPTPPSDWRGQMLDDAMARVLRERYGDSDA